MAKTRLVVAILLTGLVGGVGGAGFAHAQPDPPALVVDATKRGQIDFYMVGQVGATMTVRELDGRGGSRRIGSVVLDANGKGVMRSATRWRCDRLNRRFFASGLQDGRQVEATYSVRTPSCRERIDVGVPGRVRPGGSVRMVIRDGWGIGNLGLHLCKLESGDRSRCRDIRMPKDTPRITTSFRLHREGRARILLAGRGFRISRTVAVGNRVASGGEGRRARILAAGDSMMQGVDAFLADRLGSRARVFRDVNPNSGISKPGLSWAQHARDHTRRVRPDASIIFLGANEGFALRSASGQLVACCDAVWYGEFASRVRSMMITYSRAGKADVFWLRMPAPKSPQRQALQNVVNAAVMKAAEGLPRVRIVRLDEVFTPGGVYRDVITYRGRRVRVRESDGIHLSLEGAEIAAARVTAALRAARIVR